MSPSRLLPIARAHRRTRAPRLVGTYVIAAMLALATVSCSIFEPESRSKEQIELTRNRQRWTAAGIHDYAFDYRLLCFCGPGVTDPVRITVRAGAIVAVVRQSDGLPVAGEFGWLTVDGLFADIQSRLDQHVASMTVEYDPTYGYPRSIAVDLIASAADDEYSRTAGDLSPLP